MQTTGNITAIRYNLGNRIRLLRMSQELSQYKFARMVNIDRSFIIGIEKGRRNLSFEMLCKIAAGLDVSLSELCQGIDDRASIERQLELMEQLMEEGQGKGQEQA